MGSFTKTIRRLLHRTPRRPEERVRTVRNEILETAKENRWEWAAVERAGKTAYSALNSGQLPPPDDDILEYIREACEDYRDRGYPLDDLQTAVDGVQARASARQATDGERRASPES